MSVTLAEDHACDLAISAIKEASTIRSLKQKVEVPCLIRDKESVKKHLLEMVTSKIPPLKMELEGYVYKRLGFLPKEFDYEKGLIDLYVSQLGGYYDPEHKYFVMAGWIPPMLQTTIAVHELTHALQDQYYNLDKFMDPNIESSDTLLARSALVEGDATLVMLDYSRKLVGQGPLQKEADVNSMLLQSVIGGAMTSGMGSVPQSLQVTLLFPYTSGLRFAHMLLQKNGYRSIDDAFKAAPRSTEEILHPDKYNQAKPDFVNYTNKEIDAGENGIYHDTFGEFTISALLGMFVQDKAQVANAAAGWGGDRLGVYGVSGKRTVRWLTNWDTIQDADEFLVLYKPVLEKMYSKEQLSIIQNSKTIKFEIKE